MVSAADDILKMNGLVGFFCTNQGVAEALLTATSDGADLDKTSGKYKNLVVVGFDSGHAQLSAVKNGWFLGSITQDPYNMGYMALELAYKAWSGQNVVDVDTGYKFYDASNMNRPDVSQLLYN
jgi:ribose transport system substrate-binding protein